MKTTILNIDGELIAVCYSSKEEFELKLKTLENSNSNKMIELENYKKLVGIRTI